VYASRTFDIEDETKSTVINVAGNPLEQIEAVAAGCPRTIFASAIGNGSANCERATERIHIGAGIIRWHK
jgi:hypothetical protein